MLEAFTAALVNSSGALPPATQLRVASASCSCTQHPSMHFPGSLASPVHSLSVRASFRLEFPLLSSKILSWRQSAQKQLTRRGPMAPFLPSSQRSRFGKESRPQHRSTESRIHAIDEYTIHQCRYSTGIATGSISEQGSRSEISGKATNLLAGD